MKGIFGSRFSQRILFTNQLRFNHDCFLKRHNNSNFSHNFNKILPIENSDKLKTFAFNHLFSFKNILKTFLYDFGKTFVFETTFYVLL